MLAICMAVQSAIKPASFAVVESYTKNWTQPVSRRVVDRQGTRYLGNGNFRVKAIAPLALQPISSVSRLTSSSLPSLPMPWPRRKLPGQSLSLLWLRLTLSHWGWLRVWRGPAPTSRG